MANTDRILWREKVICYHLMLFVSTCRSITFPLSSYAKVGPPKMDERFMRSASTFFPFVFESELKTVGRSLSLNNEINKTLQLIRKQKPFFTAVH